jgi:hypothetical protein
MTIDKTSLGLSLFILPYFLANLFCSSAANVFAQETYDPEYVWYDPEKIVTAEPCSECHKSEYQAWKKTKHATGFKTLHRKESAERIAKEMGFKLIKRESLCLKCHYLAGIKRNQLRAISGVSCESCHGAAKEWINVHNNYGKGFSYHTETPEHKAQRITESKAKGMFRPSEIYEVVTNCFQCHTVPHEKLVNVGGHPSGSSDFEVLQRVDEIRHNFLQAQFDPARTENAERAPERKRVMYVVGRAADLEYSIRGAAVAKASGGYMRAMQRRIRSAINKLKAITNRVNVPEVDQMLQIVGQVNVRPNNESSLVSAALKIGEVTKKFIKNHDGTQLASLDGLISGTKEPVAEVAPAATEESESVESPESEKQAVGASKVESPTIETREPETSETRKPAEAERPSKPNLADVQKKKPDLPAYPKKKYIRPRSQRRTIGPSCDCHKEQNKWWETDRHFSSINPFVDRAQKNVQIARLYGLKVSEITKGNRLCMDCHGTVITGDESEDVFDGVSCESCHGPAGDYKKPHSADNPPNGYSVGKDFGMALLENLDVRAEACAQCHYITDPKLISTGHPSGTNFDFVQGNQKIRHWKQPIATSGALKSAFDKLKQRRGAIPQVARVLSTEPPPSSSKPPSQEIVVEQQTQVTPPKPPTVRPVNFRPQSLSPPRSAKSTKLPPFPAINENTSVEEILLILKERLELLYEKTGK